MRPSCCNSVESAGGFVCSSVGVERLIACGRFVSVVYVVVIVV